MFPTISMITSIYNPPCCLLTSLLFPTIMT